MYTLNKRQIGKGWIEPPYESQITFLDQYLNSESSEWTPCPILKKDKALNLGRMNYRRPVSKWNKFRAFLAVLPSLINRLIWGFRTRNNT